MHFRLLLNFFPLDFDGNIMTCSSIIQWDTTAQKQTQLHKAL